ncbi:uncharacterized protein LOC124467010 [Hypomesus transpacificus]|uniref:uncharacterized protein LOC124467010 n=1 Tax=Hypomesus transpacificus TaxID=137520 RepID=UPI001F079B57|nr:uncharacterized protein LOC124467010 [Hypomesus transpacificus]
MDLFAETTKRFVNCAKGDFIPNTVFHDSKKLLDPTRLVVKIKPWFSLNSYYRVSEFKLEHLLGDLPRQAEIERRTFLNSFSLDSEKTKKGNMDGSIWKYFGKVFGHGNMKLHFELGPTDQMELINLMALKSDIKGKEINPENIKGLKKNEKLVLVTSRVVTQGTFSIKGSDKVDASFTGRVDIHPGNLGGGGDLLRKEDTSMQLPENTVIAYKVQELIELNVNDDDKLGADGGTLSAELISDESINCLDKVLEELEEYVKLLQPLASPPKQTTSSLFGELREVLKDRPTFQRFLEDRGEDWSNSVCTLLDKLPTKPLEGSRVVTESLIRVLDALPNGALNMLANCSSSELQALNKLVLELKTNHSNFLPSETLPPKLQEGGEYNWATQLLCSTSKNLHEDGNLFRETGIQPGGLLLILCIAVQGLTFLGS